VTTDVSPATTADISDLLARACRDGRTVSIVGGGTKSGWGAIPTPTDITLSTSALNRVLAHRHGDLTATIQAGATLDAVNRELARHGQWLPLDPPWSHHATIGGIVAANDSGPRRHRYGAPRDLIIGVDVVRADGVAAKAGGIVVKNVAGYDLARLMTGSFGTLAAIVSATFKLFPLASASRTVVIDLSDDHRNAKASAERSASLLSALVHSQLTPTAIELQTPPLRILVRFETVDVAADDQAANAARMAEEAGARVSVLGDAEESALWSEHGARPWNGDGAVFKVTLLPSDVAPTVQWLSETLQCLDHDVVGRAGIGVLLVRVGGSDDTQARVLNDLRARLPVGRGSAVVVRASDALRSRVDAWGPLGEGLPLMRAIKQRFDPSGILNPGRLGL
jgi:FAD/FMN-containing dehydrogenase